MHPIGWILPCPVPSCPHAPFVGSHHSLRRCTLLVGFFHARYHVPFVGSPCFRHILLSHRGGDTFLGVTAVFLSPCHLSLHFVPLTVAQIAVRMPSSVQLSVYSELSSKFEAALKDDFLRSATAAVV